ncbi:hypothetical protein D3C77_159550 [compost metagenome]
MLAVSPQRHAHRIDGLDRTHGVALDAGHLDQPANRVAGQAQVVFHADFGGVLDLLHRAAHDLAQGAGGHRTSHAHFALAADFGTGDRGVFFVENADGGRGEEKAHHAIFIGSGDKAHVVVQHGRNDAGGAVGGRSDHAPAKGVLFVHRQGVQVDPVQHRESIAQAGFRVAAQLAIQRCRSTFDLEPARQDAFVATAGGDAVLHHLPDVQQAAAGFALRSPGRLVGQHHLADCKVLCGAMAEQFLGGLERVGQYGAVFDNAVGTGGVFIDDKASAHRIVLAATNLQARGVKGAKDHAVGVVGQGFANHRQVLLLDELDVVLAQQLEPSTAADGLQAGGDAFGIDAVGVFAFKPEQHGLVAAVALAGGAERAVQLGLDADRSLEQIVAAQPFGKARGGTHGADGMGAGGADADLEQVEDA